MEGRQSHDRFKYNLLEFIDYLIELNEDRELHTILNTYRFNVNIFKAQFIISQFIEITIDMWTDMYTGGIIFYLNDLQRSLKSGNIIRRGNSDQRNAEFNTPNQILIDGKTHRLLSKCVYGLNKLIKDDIELVESLNAYVKSFIRIAVKYITENQLDSYRTRTLNFATNNSISIR